MDFSMIVLKKQNIFIPTLLFPTSRSKIKQKEGHVFNGSHIYYKDNNDVGWMK
jgi:hypothetical protein